MSRTILAAGGGEFPVVGIKLTSGAQYISGGVGAFNQALTRIIVRGRMDAPPPNGNAIFASTSTLAGVTGWGVVGSSYAGQPGATRGAIKGYVDVYTDPTIHIPADNEGLRMRTFELIRDPVGPRLRLFIDGEEVGIGAAMAAASFTIASGIGINTRPSALGTLPWGAMTIVEVQTSTTSPTRAEILLNARSRPGRQVAGAQRLWLASDLGASGPAGVAWVDKLAGTSLTITGSPNLDSVAPQRNALGTEEWYGDSIAGGRNVATFLDGGPRRPYARGISALGRFVALCGQSSFTDAATPLDFDPKHTCVGGQCLGIDNGTATRLSTLASNVTANGGPGCRTRLAYGVNDLVHRVVTVGQTPADAAAALLADVDTACGLIRVSRTGRIWIHNVLRISTVASGSTPNSRAAIDLYNTALASYIDTLNATHGNVSLVDVCSRVTSSQAVANDTGVLFDGTHLTPTSNDNYGDECVQRSIAVG